MQSSPRIEELRQKFHENPRRYFAPLANEYRKAGDPEQAIAICRAHLAQQPGHMSGHVVYGQALYDARRADEAREVFLLALALDPENIIVLRHLGDIARQRGDVEEARTWYSRALDGDPHDAEVAAYLAELTEPLLAGGEENESAAPAPFDTGTEVAAPPEDAEATAAPPEDAEATVTPVEDIEKVPESPYAEPAAVADAPEASTLPSESPYLEPVDETISTGGDAEADAVQSPAIKELRPTPTSESFPIVTRTLAELYLEQGHIEPALDIYRQLAAHEPQDSEIRARIEELSPGEPVEQVTGDADLMEEAAGAGEISESGHDEFGDQADTGIAAERNFPESEQSTELWDTADSWGGGFFADTEDEGEIFGMSDGSLSSGAGLSDKQATGGEESAPGGPPVEVASRELTVREFFATLGSMRPPFNESGGGTEPIADLTPITGESPPVEMPAAEEPYPIADNAFANLFGDTPISPEDSRAAAALSGAMAHGAPFSTPITPPGPPPRRDAAAPHASDQPTQESEEDIRRFREWLDGLAES